MSHVTNFEIYKVVHPPPTTTLHCTPLSTIIHTMAPSTAADTSKPKQRSDLLRFSTHRHLRQRILLSVLSGKSLRIDNIRSDDVHVGLRDYEVNLLRLVEKVTNGSTIEISVTGMAPLNKQKEPVKKEKKEADE
jgi:hypothetical protein